MNDEILFIQLRDCFYAGYNLPQFCFDLKIKNPLFVITEQNSWQRLWEIHAQFSHDKRFKPTFAIFNGEEFSLRLSPTTLFDELKAKNFSKLNLDDYDRIFFMTSQRQNLNSEKISYLDELRNFFVAHTYVEIPILHFLQSHPKVKFFLTNFPILINNGLNSDWEKKIISENIPLAKITENLKADENYKTPYDFLGYSREELLQILDLPNAKINLDGSSTNEDSDKPLVQVKNGQRVVPNQPEKFINRIYFLAGCSHYGVGAPFDKTIPSYLQKFLNEKNLPYRVENLSQLFTFRYQDMFYNLQNLELSDGDIIFCFLDDFTSKIIPTFDVSKIFLRPHNYGEVYVDIFHVNEIGYKVLAEKFFEMLTQNNFFQNVEINYPMPPPQIHRYGIPKENFSATNFLQNKDLENYKKILRTKKIPVGAIVMNCNPFTLGHEYLISCAAKKVSKLYIFVVEEDRSDFKFQDRFELVKLGTKKFSNVEILPSGKFIISQKTFSGYFNKENLQDVAVDSSEDVEIFGREIAPTLGITVRFVGEEPEDTVTKSYNETMKKILPKYGVEVCEIERKKISGEVISAKKVRELLKVGDFDKLKNLVPKSTLKFLQKNFLR